MSDLLNKFVVITTEWRGVFCGKLVEYDRANRVAVLQETRHAVYWSAGVKGVIGLASVGPDSACRISTAFKGQESAEFHGITSVAECSPEALKRWEAEPWS